MSNFKKYILEYFLLGIVVVLCVPGFWTIYFGVNASPSFYQNLHVATTLTWLFLLLYQLTLIAKQQHTNHKKIGLSILFFGPLLFATTALLSVHSAHKGVVSGEGDFLLVQNVMGSLELGLVILLAFIFKKRRKVHGSFLLSTAILFLGIALFFTFTNVVPQFKIEGPETFYRFGTAAATARNICLVIGLLFFLKDRANGWPVLLVSLFFPLNEYVNQLLAKNNMLQPLLEAVGSLSKPITFIGSFVVLLLLLAVTGVTYKRPGATVSQPSAG